VFSFSAFCIAKPSVAFLKFYDRLEDLRAFAIVYVDFFRGVPGILVIYLYGFGIPALGLEGVTDEPEFWGIVTLVIVLGGILTGVFTPIEAGAVACVWAFFVTMFIYRDYKWSELPLLVYKTLQTVAMVLTLVATASCFGYVAALMQMPAKMTEFFVAISSNKYVLLMWLNIMLLVLGTALDLAPLLLICTPILLPVVKSFGIDPVHFGIVMLLNLGIGLLTPPVGTTLFVGCAIGKVSVDEVMRGIWPFYYVMFTVLMIVTYVPWLSLALPRAFGF